MPSGCLTHEQRQAAKAANAALCVNTRTQHRRPCVRIYVSQTARRPVPVSHHPALFHWHMDSLREQVMINQFVLAAGCARDQAKQLLQATQWQFETALSVYFEQASAVGHRQNGHFSMIAPANTPATPPNFPETLMAFSKLSAGSDHTRMTTSPTAVSYLSPGTNSSSQLSGSTSSPQTTGPSVKQGRSSSRYNTIPITSPYNH